MARVLVVAGHPDDEVLGVGGAILRHVEQGDEVHVHIACCHGLRDREQRVADAERVAAEMGTHLSIGWLPQLGTHEREATPIVERLVANLAPDVVYTHHPGDLNRDHRALTEAVAIATRPYSSSVRVVRHFETPSSTEWGGPAGRPPFVPNLFVKVDAGRKATLLERYGSETRPWPHPRDPVSLMHRAYYWGQVSGFGAAEAFVTAVERW